MTTKPTLKQLTTPTICRAALAVVAARALAKVQRKAIDQIEASVLAAMPPIWFEGEIIDKAADLFLVVNTPAFDDFIARKRIAQVAAGFVVDGDYCPALVAEAAQRDAEQALLDAVAATCATFAGFSKAYGDIRKEILETVLEFVVPFATRGMASAH